MNNRRILIALGAILASPLALILVVVLAAGGAGGVSSGSTTTQSASDSACVTPAAPGTTANGVTLNTGQIANAQLIDSVGVANGVPQRGEIIAVATALQESSLNNLPSGDRDSVGLFQQRPSQGWGTPAQLMDPTYAATQFYDHLTAVRNWQSLPLSEAAQDVQRSAFPDAYAKWEPLATQLVSTATTGGGNCATDNGDGSTNGATGKTTMAGYTIPSGTPPQIATVLDFALAQLGKPYAWGGSGPNVWDCSGLTQAAYATIGIQLGRTTYVQATQGTPIYSFDQLQPGDLLFIPGADGTAAMPGHVGMYLGNGQLIQAPHTGAVVEISPLNQWTNQVVAMRRMVSQGVL